MNRFGDVMIAPIDYGKPRSSKTKNCTIGLVNIAPLENLKRKYIDLLTRNKDNALEWSDMFNQDCFYWCWSRARSISLSSNRK